MRNFSRKIFNLHQLDKVFPRLKSLKKIGIVEEIREIHLAHERETKRKAK